MTTVILAKANIIDIAKELNTSALTYEYLCLSKTQKWCNELLYSLENVPISEESSIINYSKVNGFKRLNEINSNFVCLKIFGKDYKLYQLAKSYFNQKEFARSVYYLNKSESQLCYFLSVYAKYMVLLLLLLLLLIIMLNHFQYLVNFQKIC
jgi:hypothetical protein